jgi:hypothetical protein
LLVAVVMTVSLTACGSPTPKPSPSASPAQASLPDTPAGRQAHWLLGAVAHHPVPAVEFAAHFDRAYLATVPTPAAATLNASWQTIKGLRFDAVTSSAPGIVVFTVTVNGKSQWSVRVTTDAQGLISGLHLQPAGATPPPALPLPSASATIPASGGSSVQQIAVGVGSPPLRATLTLPAGKGPFPVVVLVSGSGPNDQNETIGPTHPFLDIALGLAARGIASLRYDKRTRDYPQDLDPRTFTMTEEYVPDALAAIRLLEHTPIVDAHRIFVLGHSQGGTYAPLIAKRAPQLAGVIMLAAGAEQLGAAMLRQLRYLATLPGTTGDQAKAQLPQVEQLAVLLDSPAALEKESLTTVLLGGAGPAYFLSGLRYNEVATARAIPQPLLFLQGDRDYQVTVKDDLDVWLRGLMGRKGVTVVQFPGADHLFLDGSGPPTPVEYADPGHVDPKVIATIAAWVRRIRG